MPPSGDVPESDPRLDGEGRQAAELPHLPEAAHTRRFFGTMLLERNGPGDRAEATQMATEAAELYRRMGMPRHLELAAGLLNTS